MLAITMASCAQKKEVKTDDNTPKVLVAYFSATGTTEGVAKVIADNTGGTLYKITPATPYTSGDLDWNGSQSRSSKESADHKARPAIKSDSLDISKYNVIFLGYPIWWNEAPRVVNTFIEQKGLKGKTVIPFATSGGSSITNSVKRLKATYPYVSWQEGQLLNGGDQETAEWAKSIMDKYNK